MMTDITTRALDGDLFAVQTLVVERDALRAERDRLRDGTEQVATQARELRVETDRLRAELAKRDEEIERLDHAIKQECSVTPTSQSVQNEIGIPACGGPLCNEMDHHPLCSKAPTLPKPGEE